MNAVTGQESYLYDGHGRRARTLNLQTGTIEYFGYGRDGRLLQDWSNRRQVRNGYIYLGNTLVGLYVVDLTNNSNSAKYQHTDALGSPVVTTNASKTVLSRMSYTPYGQPTLPMDGVGYTGHFVDVGTQLTYMQQRYYDPAIGRFLSVDPAASEFNRYNYASNNPYRFADPDGRSSVNHFVEEPFYSASSTFEMAGTFTVGGHGNENSIVDSTGDHMNPYRAYDQYISAGLERGQDMFFISCRTGMANKEGVVQAQVFSRENGSNVYGADGWVNYSTVGNVTTLTVWAGRGRTGAQGAFRLFKPGSKHYVRGRSVVAVIINRATGAVTLVFEDGVQQVVTPRTDPKPKPQTEPQPEPQQLETDRPKVK